jgi:hypothetical protein
MCIKCVSRSDLTSDNFLSRTRWALPVSLTTFRIIQREILYVIVKESRWETSTEGDRPWVINEMNEARSVLQDDWSRAKLGS